MDYFAFNKLRKQQLLIILGIVAKMPFQIVRPLLKHIAQIPQDHKITKITQF